MTVFFIKLLMLPIALVCEIWGVLLSAVGIFEFRFNIFFKRFDLDDVVEEMCYANAKKHRVIFTIPFILCTIFEIVIIIPFFLCARIINAIMEVIPYIMVIPSLIFGYIMGMLVFVFNHAQYHLLDAYKKSQCLPEHFIEVHPTVVLTRKMSGMQ